MNAPQGLDWAPPPGRVRDLLINEARRDPAAFAAFVLRDEETQVPIAMAPMHYEWHELANKHRRLIIWSHVEGGKTNQIVIARVLYELMRNPNMRIAVISNTSDMAKKIVRAIGQYIVKSEALHLVAPHLQATRDPSLPWTSQSLTIERQGTAKDPSVQAAGVHGNVMGSRIDLLIIDDILDHENTRTPVPRADVVQWVRSSLLTRLTGDEPRAIIVGNAWHPEDLLHMLAKDPTGGWKAFRFPVINKSGALSWPKRWTKKRIENVRGILGALEYARQLLCVARDDDTARFRREWVEKCQSLGDGLMLVENARQLYRAALLGAGFDPDIELDEAVLDQASIVAERLGGPMKRPIMFFTGVDLAVQQHAAADLTCLFTLALMPDLTRRVCKIESGRWNGPQILDKIAKRHQDFGGVFVVENVGAQDYLLQFAHERFPHIDIRPYTTGRTKAHPEFGVEALAAEFAGGRWIIPNAKQDKEIDNWISELLFYDPPPTHTGDRLMASWFAQMAARTFESGVLRARIGVRVFGPGLAARHRALP